MSDSFLILGSNGQLGREFVKEFTARRIPFTAPDERDCDITSTETMATMLDGHRPSVVLNCAAYNAVDQAEAAPDTAYRINAEAVRTVAELCRQRRIMLVHYSSDYIFDGRKGSPYTEQDPAGPLNVYGRSKRAGEEAVLHAGGEHLLLRTSWVFGNGPQNFIHKLLQWSKKNPVLRLTADETSVPTCTLDIVDVTLDAVRMRLSGLYHLTNSGVASRYDWGRYVAEKLALSSEIQPASLDEFPSPARRPKYSAMSNAALTSALGRPIPAWQDAVDRFLTVYPQH